MRFGILHIVATPIGNLADITARALETLRSVDLILCEDTRVSRKLLAHFNISKPLLSYHQHSSLSQVDKIISLLRGGKNLALITDAGTPGIADPGGKLVAAILGRYPYCHSRVQPSQPLRRRGQSGNPVVKRVEPWIPHSRWTSGRDDISIVPIPGPSAMTTALSVCGFDTTQFVFLGWPPHKKGRDTWFKNIAAEPRVAVFYESVYRIKNCLERLAALCPERRLMLARELTKKFETVYRGTAADILSSLTPEQVKGEFVLVMDVISTDTRKINYRGLFGKPWNSISGSG